MAESAPAGFPGGLPPVPPPLEDEIFDLQFVRPNLYPKQLAAIYNPKRMSLIEASTKAGKAQPLDALVYTPTGPRPMREIEAGDMVLTPGGERFQ